MGHLEVSGVPLLLVLELTDRLLLSPSLADPVAGLEALDLGQHLEPQEQLEGAAKTVADTEVDIEVDVEVDTEADTEMDIDEVDSEMCSAQDKAGKNPEVLHRRELLADILDKVLRAKEPELLHSIDEVDQLEERNT